MAEYQGFTNEETWAVCLMLSNEKESQAVVYGLANEGGEPQDRQEAIRDYVEGLIPEDLPPMAKQLVEVALWQVDWAEIDEHYRED